MNQNKLIVLSIVIFTATFIQWLPTTGFGFINFDDPRFIEENPLIYLHPLKTFYHSITTVVMSNWIPLTFASFSLDYHLYGLNAPGFHLTNIIFHACNAVLVFYIFFILLEKFYPQSNKSYLNAIFAAISSLLWANHPFRVEAVAWVSARKDVLFMFFCLFSIIFYLKYISNLLKSKTDSFLLNRFYLLSILMMILSLLSKGMAVTLPFVFLIVDYLYKRNDYKRAIMEKIPFFILSVLFSYIQILTRPTTLPDTNELSLSIRIINACSGLGFYLEKTLFPLNLVPVYYYEGHKPDYFIYIFISGLASVLLLIILFLKGNRFVKASVIFYIITLLPVIGIMQTWIQEYADRFSYFPTLPLYLGFGIAGIKLVHYISSPRMKVRTVTNNHFILCAKYKILLLSSVIFFIYTFLCSKQIMLWETPYTLWNHQINVRPHPLPYLVLGDYSMTQKNPQKALDYYTRGYQSYPQSTLFLPRISIVKKLLNNHQDNVVKEIDSKLLQPHNN